MGEEVRFEEIQSLMKHVKALSSGLEAEIAQIDDHFHSLELDYMYGNVGGEAYAERKRQIARELANFKRKLLRFEEPEVP